MGAMPPFTCFSGALFLREHNTICLVLLIILKTTELLANIVMLENSWRDFHTKGFQYKLIEVQLLVLSFYHKHVNKFSKKETIYYRMDQVKFLGGSL